MRLYVLKIRFSVHCFLINSDHQNNIIFRQSPKNKWAESLETSYKN